MEEIKEPPILDPFQMLKFCFPTVYGQGSKQNAFAEHIFKSVITYLNQDRDIFKKDKEREKLIDILTKSSRKSQKGTLEMIFCCEYACAVLMTKERKQSPITISIICPQGWVSGSDNWRRDKLDFYEPDKFLKYHVTQVSQNVMSLKEFKPKFSKALKQGISIILQRNAENKKQSEDSIKVVEQACKFAQQRYFRWIYQIDTPTEQQQKKDIKQHKTSSQSIIFNQSDACTCWYVPQAIISALIKSDEKNSSYAEKVIIGFKASLLMEFTSLRAKQKKYDQNEVAYLKKCYDQLILRYRNNVSKEQSKANKGEDFLEAMKKISKNIKIITNNGLTSQIKDVQQEADGSLPFSKVQLPTFVYPEKEHHEHQEIELVHISDYPFQVDARQPFQELLELGKDIQKKQLIEQGKWILLTENTFFKIADQFSTNRRIIDLKIHMNEIECEFGGSNLMQVVEKYEKIIKNKQKHFGFGMIGQARSHIQLMKTIAAIITFESVKMNRKRKKSNLDGYRIPIDIDKFYKQFISNSYEARRAMKKLKVYNSTRKANKPLFVMDGSSNSFAEFGRLVAKDTRSTYFWIQKMEELLQLKKQLAVEKIKVKNEQCKKDKALTYLRNTLGATYQYHSTYSSYENNVQNASTYAYAETVYTQMNNKDPELFAFVENIPSDVLALIKSLFIAQNPKEFEGQRKQNLFTTPFVQSFPLHSYSQPPKIEQIGVSSNSASIESIYEVKSYNSLKLLSGKSEMGNPIADNHFQNYQKVFFDEKTSELEFRFFYEPVKQKQIREHTLYARQKSKIGDMQIQQFLGVGNIRSGENTQMLLLCLNVLQKKVASNSFDQTCRLAEETFLQTSGQLSTYDAEVQKHFKQIRNLIKNFIKFWAFTDVNFCPILGPFMGYISRELFDDNVPIEAQKDILQNITYELCKRCIIQFERGEEQLKRNANLGIYWNQRFICMAAICCFRETKMKIEEEEKIMTLCMLIFQLRTCKILSDREEKPKDKRIFEEELAFSVEKAIMLNIEVISNLLDQKQEHIDTLIKRLDPSYPADVEWQKQNVFSFTGKSAEGDDIYQIDLYLGKIYKNGKQISALDERIKNNKDFKEIFGDKREFEVFQSPNQFYVRTKNNVNHQFKISEETGLVFFEFAEDGSKIRHIYKKPGDHSKNQDIWQLIPRRQISKSKCNFPKIFLANHLAWYSAKRKCIIFRKIKFENMHDIGLVIHLQAAADKPVLRKSFHIVFYGSDENQDLDAICDINTEKYDEIILRSNDQKLSEIRQFKAISRFEDPQYVFEIKNKKTKETEYILHRYQIKFKLEDEKRLSSETYFGYCLDYSFYENENVLFNKFPCLVLRKFSKNPALLNSHKRIVLVSKGKILPHGKILKTPQADTHIDCFKYEVHDFFGDLRGMNRESNFHLANIMLSINDNIKISTIEMTPIEYCFYLLNSCFSNRPMTKEQVNILENIVKVPEFDASESIVLLCESLWRCAEALSNVLPFQNSHQLGFIYGLDNKFMTCRTLYEKKYQEASLKYRETISKDILDYLGVKIYRRYDEKSSSSDSDSSSQEQQIYWRKVQSYKYRGENLVGSIEDIKKEFTAFEKESEKMNIWDQHHGLMLKEKEKFPKEILQLPKKPDANIMMKQLVNELEDSYNTFTNQESRIEAIAAKIKGEQLKAQINLTEKLIDQGTACLKRIQHEINYTKELNQANPDIISGLRPTLSYISFTKLLCFRNQIREYFPYITEEGAESLKQLISYWFALKTRIASLHRIVILLKADKLDVVSLMREVLSPRKEVQKKGYWLAFEAQNKVQLWLSQFETYNRLMNSKKEGPFCQLNMGEGKTQVIIPMMILDTIFSKNSYLPRINLLSSLMEEARGNFFRFISATGFQIPGFEIPFTRKVKLNKKNIYEIRDLINSFSRKLYILSTRESRLSEVLRYYETNKSNKEISMEKLPILTGKVFDVFDEIDALMTSIKSYIFSIGQTQELPQSKIRLEILRNLIEVFLRKSFKQCLEDKLITTDETQADALLLIQKGQYPPGLRLNIEDLSEKKLLEFKTQLTRDVVLDPRSHHFAFMQKLKGKQVENIIQFIVNPGNSKATFPSDLSETAKNQLFLMRGAIGYGIFQHCLSMRCGVDYGAPNKYHTKKIAVPYDAADIPSRTSQYQQPDVSTILSYFAYYTKSLTQQYFLDALKGLLSLSKTSKELEYESWFNLLCEEERHRLKVKNANQINFNSKSQRQELFNAFKSNRRTIAFWLNRFVFPRDLKQYKKSICSSAWDLADVGKSIGFSGTKDNHWLYSDKLTWTPCETPAIKGTDGKMIYLIGQYTTAIKLIQENEKVLWQRFVDLCLLNNVGAIIDSGALCVGKSLQNEIVPWIAEHDNFDKQKYQGILFCDALGKWKVYDIESKYYIPRGTTIPDHKTFVIFDQARTRGADIKMDSEVVAAISLGPKMTKDKFMQAAGRLRKLGRDQKLIIMATQQIFSSFSGFPKTTAELKHKVETTDKKTLANIILAWCCKNSVQSNEKMLVQFANLGWNHIKSKVNNHVHENQIDSTLKGMYESPLQKTTVAKICEKMVIKESKLNKKVTEHKSGVEIVNILKNYGKNVFKQAGALDDVCQREVEAERQREKEQENQFYELQPVAEVESPKILTKLSDIPLNFGKKFSMTSNFIETTRGPRELADVYFILYDANDFQLITLREASIFIGKHIIAKQKSTTNIALLHSLSIEDELIQKYGLSEALVSAKFLAGIENYTKEEEDILLKILLKSSQEKKQWSKNYFELASVILKKKRIYLRKFMGSTLEKMVIRLQNEGIRDDLKEEMKLNKK